MTKDQLSPSSRKSSSSSTLAPDEQSPLLIRKASRASVIWRKSAVYRVLLTSFLVSLSFGVTQVPLIYVFGVMTCDEYYKTHPSPSPGLDRCKVPEIEAGTARAVALLGASTTLFGVVNLFFTGWTMKAFGIKKALALTVFFPAVRLAVQNVGVEMSSGVGILIIQASQIITIVGGPVGYMLALNSLATEVVEPAERTGVLGRLSGCAMFGIAIGYLAGGLIGEYCGIIWPFRVTLALFLLCFVYIWLFLPEITNKDVAAKATKSLAGFFDPIKMFIPRKWVLKDGRVVREYGVLLLGIGTFLGVLATSYIPVLLQLYATDVFDFGSSENGYLISLNSIIRGLFLTFAFPKLIARGRIWLDARLKKEIPAFPSIDESGIPSLDAGIAPQDPPASPTETTTFQFDLHFTQYSLILDGLLTGLATFTSQSYQMYVIAVILPLASGTGPAAKGTILAMCTPEQRTDALSAISLVELIARLSSVSLFGLVFAVFAKWERPNWTFAGNALVAVIGFVVLIAARFPTEGAVRWYEDDSREGEETERVDQG